MSQTLDPVGAAPDTRTRAFWALLFAAAAAPLFWLGQVMLGYAVTAYACYPGDHPIAVTFAGALHAATILFDIVAALGAAAGGLVALSFWRRKPVADGTASYVRFLALWGIFSSLWFFCAILFNAIASFTVPPCLW